MIQDHFMLTVNAKNFPDSTKVFLFNKELDKNIDSSYVIGERFTFSGKADLPTFSYLFFFDKNGKRLEPFKFFYLENSKVSIDGEYADFLNATVKGSNQSALLTEYLSISKRIRIERDEKLAPVSIDSIVKNSINQDHKKGFRISVDSIKKSIADRYDKRIEKNENQFIFENSNNQMTLNALLTFKRREISKDSFLLFYKRVDSTLANSRQGRELYYYAHNSDIKKGDKFRDVVGVDLEGNTHRLSDYRGKVILLDFWAASCGPCRNQNKTEFQKIARAYGKDDFVLISYSLDTNKSVWRKSSNADNIYWINISDLKGMNGENGKKYTITSLPNSFLIDRNGVIVKSFVGFYQGENSIEKQIDKLLE
ncbi:TlpA disulfide reductase family protein [uncultured Kriegella sp.]|uniref:TlpA disulfide reductase family protein n=1 Tax=uncultured Kriegella sp. TaxID=1798910 RepID=UPI0030D7F11A